MLDVSANGTHNNTTSLGPPSESSLNETFHLGWVGGGGGEGEGAAAAVVVVVVEGLAGRRLLAVSV